MSLTKLEENLNIIENLPDSPNMEAVELKRKFDESSLLIKKFINETLTVEIDKLVTQIKKDVNSQMLEDNKKRYYVGKLILDTKNINPASYLGFGTWELWGAGKVPVGVDTNDTDFSTAEKIGGEKTHTLTISEIPSHNHARAVTNAAGGSAETIAMGNSTSQSNIADFKAIQKTGGGKPHNNMPPYITCYIWKRVS